MVVVAASAEGRPAGSAGVGAGGRKDLQEHHVDLMGEEGLLEQKVVEGDLLEHYVVRRGFAGAALSVPVLAEDLSLA